MDRSPTLVFKFHRQARTLSSVIWCDVKMNNQRLLMLLFLTNGLVSPAGISSCPPPETALTPTTDDGKFAANADQGEGDIAD